MIRDSVAYLKGQGKVVFFDAEHFFDGFRDNAEYALECLRAAAEAGADCLVLCDTNGGTITSKVVEAVAAARRLGAPVGIHAHNDADLAVANTLAAVEAGATHVQGTHQRLRRALRQRQPGQRHRQPQAEDGDRLRERRATGAPDGGIALRERGRQHGARPACALRGGKRLHPQGRAARGGDRQAESSYQHVEPELVGNEKRVLVSELAGLSQRPDQAEGAGRRHSPQR